jgi:SAM-dependent methyltransferase
LLIAVPYVVNQARKPTRWVGRAFAWAMNASHASLTNWGLKQVRVEKPFMILDVGCGGGETIHKLAGIATEGRVSGVDYAEGSVAASRARNAALIRAGRVDIQRATVSRLPFRNDTFDLVTAVETHYYWPDLPQDMKEIRRVVKPGGTMVLIAESYKGNRNDWLHRLVMKPLRAAHLSAEEHRDLFTASGFSDVQLFEQRAMGWLCVTGTRPAGPRIDSATEGT